MTIYFERAIHEIIFNINATRVCYYVTLICYALIVYCETKFEIEKFKICSNSIEKVKKTVPLKSLFDSFSYLDRLPRYMP